MRRLPATLARRVRRLLSRTAAAVALVGALVVIACVAGWNWLQSEAGGQLLRLKVIEWARDELAGRLEIDRLSLDADELVLRGLRLSTPEGELVFACPLLRARIDLKALTSGSAVLPSLVLHDPVLSLRRDARGLNLARALERRKLAPSARLEPPGRFELRGVELASVRLLRGTVTSVDEARNVRITELEATGQARVDVAPLRVDGTLELKAAACEPFIGPCGLTASARSPSREIVLVEAALSAGASRASGQLEWPALEGRNLKLSLAPEQARLVVADWPLRLPLELSGAIGPSGGRLVVGVGDVASGTIEGRYDAAARAWSPLRADFSVPGLVSHLEGRAAAHSLDLAGSLDLTDARRLRAGLEALVGVALPETTARGRLSLRMGGPPLRPSLALAGRLEQLRAPPLAVESVELDVRVPDVTAPFDTDGTVVVTGFSLGEARIDRAAAELKTSGRRVEISAVATRLGAARLRAVGVLDADQLGLALVELTVFDDERAWALEAPAGVAWRGGVASVEALALGSDTQRLVLVGRANERSLDARLTVSGLRLEALPAVLRIRDLPLRGRVDGQVQVKGAWARLSGGARGTLHEARIGDVSVREASLELEGSRSEGIGGTLTVQSSLGRASARVALPPLWNAGGQSAPLSAQLDGDGLEVAALADLAKARVPAAGVLDWKASVTGTWDAPRVGFDAHSARLAWQLPVGGRGRGLDTSDVRLRASLAPGEALSAEVTMALLGGELAASLTTDATLERLLHRPPDVVEARSLVRRLELKTSSIHLAALREAGLIDAVKVTDGVNVVDAKVTEAAKVADANVAGANVADAVNVGDVVNVGDAGRLAAKTGGSMTPPGTSQGSVQATDGLELEGVLAGSVVVTGPLDHPTVEARATLVDGAYAKLRAVNGELTLSGDGAEIRASVVFSVKGAPLLLGEAHLSAPVIELLEPARLTRAPLRLDAQLRPIALSTFGRREAPLPVSGTASASLGLRGTLDAPTVTLDAGVDELVVEGVALGSGRLRLTPDAGAAGLELELVRDGGIALAVRGVVAGRPSVSWLREPRLGADAGVDLAFDARDFDVSVLSGVSENLRSLEGTVSVHGTVTGTVAQPRLRGGGQWRGGRAVLRGVGDLRDVEADFGAEDDTLQLTRLRARAGAGRVELKGKAQHLSSGAFRVEVEGETQRFPLLRDDQLLAFVTMRASGSADVSRELVDFTTLEIPRAEVQLPELMRKDLQDLQRPRDIRLVQTVRRRASLGRAPSDGPSSGAHQDAAPNEPPWLFRARCTAPRNLWITSSDVKLEVGLSEGFLVEYGDALRLSGRATVQRGRLNVIGREFELQKGAHARFAGAASQPVIDAQALYVQQQDGERTTVTVTVTGRGSEVAFKVSAEPPMPESEIYTLLATGRRALRRGGGASVTPEQAVSVVGSVAASALKTVLAREVPIDVLNLEAADGFRGVGDLKVDVGKYLGDSLFLGFSVQPGAKPERGESQYTGRLELQLSGEVSAEAWAGTAPAMGAGVVWSREY